MARISELSSAVSPDQAAAEIAEPDTGNQSSKKVVLCPRVAKHDATLCGTRAMPLICATVSLCIPDEA
jgi:hypothetical protein